MRPLLLSFIPLLLLTPLLTLSASPYGEFVPLVGIPYTDTTDNDLTLGDYVNALYIAAISIAAVLAVLRIIYAGVQYMLSDIVTQKGAAKKTIRNALLGLVLIVAAFLILETINPQLTSLNSLNQLEGVTVTIDDVDLPPQPEPPTCRATGIGSEDCTEENCNGEWAQATDGVYECRGDLTTITPPPTDEEGYETAIETARQTGEPVFADAEKTKPLVCTDSGRDACIGQCQSLGGNLTVIEQPPDDPGLIARCDY